MSPKRECLLTGVEVRNVGSKGLGIVGKGPLALGTVAVQERPYATSLLPQSTPGLCRTCFGSINTATKGLQACRRCGGAYYCSYKCASLDRRAHRDSGECWLYEHTAGLSLVAPAGLQREAVLALRHLATTAPATYGSTPQSPLSCNKALLAPDSQLERELAGWQAAALASAVLQRQAEAGLEREADIAECTALPGELAEAVVGEAADLAEAAGLGPGLALLAVLLARAAAAGRAATAAHHRAVRRRAQRKQEREQRRRERQQRQEERRLQAQEAGGDGGGPAAATGLRAPGTPKSSSSESSYESSSSDDGGCGSYGGLRSDCRRDHHRPRSAQAAMQSVLQLQPALQLQPLPAASAGCDARGPALMPPPRSGNGCRTPDATGASEGRKAAGVAAGVIAAVQSAAVAVGTVLSNALEVTLHPPFAAGLIGAGRAAAGAAAPPPGPLGLPLAMYRHGCRLNHSCRPTAAAHFRPGGQLLVRLTADLDAGAEVTLSYVDLALPRRRRRIQLREKYGFGCACERCCGGAVCGGAAVAVAAGDGGGGFAGIAAGAASVATADDLLSSPRALERCSGQQVPSGGARVLSEGLLGSEAGEEDEDEAAATDAGAGRSAIKANDGGAAQVGEVDVGAAAGGSAAAAPTAATSAGGAGLEQRLQRLVQHCGDLLLLQERQRPAGAATAEPAFAALVSGLDELLAEARRALASGPSTLAAQTAGAAQYRSNDRGAGGQASAPAAVGELVASAAAAGPAVATGDSDGGSGSSSLAFSPQHAACLDAYALLASAARRCARACTAGIDLRQAVGASAGAPALAADGGGAEGGDCAPWGEREQRSQAGKEAPALAVAAVAWWARAMCASVAGAAAAERLLAAEPALLPLAAASWSDAASTACELLSALFGTAAEGPSAEPGAAGAGAAREAVGADDTAARAEPPRSQLFQHDAWNPPGAAKLSGQPAQPAAADAGAAEATAGTASSPTVTLNGCMAPGCGGGPGDGVAGDVGDASPKVCWSRGGLTAAARAALAADRRALAERYPQPQQHQLQGGAGQLQAPRHRHDDHDHNRHKHAPRHHAENGNGVRDIYGADRASGGDAGACGERSQDGDGRARGPTQQGLKVASNGREAGASGAAPGKRRHGEEVTLVERAVGASRPREGSDWRQAQRSDEERSVGRSAAPGGDDDSEEQRQERGSGRHGGGDREAGGRDADRPRDRDGHRSRDGERDGRHDPRREGARARGLGREGERERDRDWDRDRRRSPERTGRRDGGHARDRAAERAQNGERERPRTRASAGEQERGLEEWRGRDRDGNRSNNLARYPNQDRECGRERGYRERRCTPDTDRGRSEAGGRERGRQQHLNVGGDRARFTDGDHRQRRGDCDLRGDLDRSRHRTSPKHGRSELSGQLRAQRRSRSRDRSEARREDPKRRRLVIVESRPETEPRPADAAATDVLGLTKLDSQRSPPNAVTAPVAAVAPPPARWCRYTAPSCTAKSCAALFHVCRRLGWTQVAQVPAVAELAVAAMDDWLAGHPLAGAPVSAAAAWAGVAAGGGSAAGASRGSDGGNEVPGSGDLEAAAGVVAVAAAHCLARLHLLLRLLLGEAHGACEACQFLPFFTEHLPYEVAAEISQASSALLSRAHMPHVPMTC